MRVVYRTHPRGARRAHSVVVALAIMFMMTAVGLILCAGLFVFSWGLEALGMLQPSGVWAILLGIMIGGIGGLCIRSFVGKDFK